MRNFFCSEGNLGSDPTLKYVPVPSSNEQRAVLEVDVRFNFEKKNKNGEGYVDDGGFWARVNIWGKRAEIFNGFLVEGCRVLVVGEQRQETYIATKGEFAGQTQRKTVVNASAIAIIPFGIDSINYSKRKQSAVPGDYENWSQEQESNTETPVPVE